MSKARKIFQMGILSGSVPQSAPTAAMGWRAYWNAMDATQVFSDAGTTPTVVDAVDATGQAYQLSETLGVVANSYFRQTTEAQRPFYKSGGAGGKNYLLFDPTDDNMVSLATSNFFANNAKTLLLVGNTYSSISDTNVILRDASTFWDVRTRGTNPYSLRMRNYDGTYDESSGGTIVLGTPFVYAAKHDGGNLYDAVNGGAWSAAVASGNTTTMTALFNLRPARWHFYAFAVSNTVISDANIAMVVNYFKSQLGI